MSILTTIQFEGSTFCNANCTFCPKSDISRPKGTMSDELFHRIIKEGKEMGVGRFLPFLNGEPFANPKIFDWLDYMQQAGVTTCLYTNAGLLNQEKIDRLVKYPHIRSMNCSFNAASEETYRQVVRGPDFQTTKNNIDYLIKNAPFQITVSLVAIAANDHEREAFKKLWGNKAKISDFSNWAGYRHDPLEKTGPQISCKQLLRHMNILWDGRVCLCCFDFDGKVILGDLKTQSLKEIWDSARKLRGQHRRHDFNIPLCRECNYNAHKIEYSHK